MSNIPSNDIVYRLYHCPPFTKFYLTMLVVSSFFINYVHALPVFWYFAFSIKQIVHNFQIWRIFTNFLIGGKFSLGYLIMLYGLFSALSFLEHEGIRNRALSKFYSQIFYLILLIIIVSFFNKYVLNITESRSLIHELSYSFYALSAYREPEKEGMSIYLIPVKNKYSPFVMLFVSIGSGNDPAPVISGFVAGYLYVFFGDFLEERFGITVFYVPKCVRKYFRDKEKIVPRVDESQNKKEKIDEPAFNANMANSSNTALRNRETVAEGNEFQSSNFSSENVKWD